ncbi:MAG: hypothetical protein AAF723_08785, partial [Pseudomonadota bacterium]
GQAHASGYQLTSNASEVVTVYPRDTSTYIQLADVITNVTPGQSDTCRRSFQISKDAPNYDAIIATVLTAFSGQFPVRLSFDSTSTFCNTPINMVRMDYSN